MFVNILILFYGFLINHINSSCPDGYLTGNNGDCFKISSDKKAWIDAECDCQNQGGHLASATDAFTNQWLWFNVNQTLVNTNFWLGGYGNFCVSDTWNWATGNNWAYINWDMGEPNFNYIYMNFQNSKWKTDYGSLLLNYACEFKPGWTASSAPCVPLPLPSNCGKCWTNYTNACYYATTFYNNSVISNVDWMQAEANCNAYGAHLVSIHSDAENAFIIQMLQKYSQPDCTFAWLGLYTNASHNITDYRWTDGTKVDYLGENSPMADGMPRCVYLSDLDQHWHDTNSCGNWSFSYPICKKVF